MLNKINLPARLTLEGRHFSLTEGRSKPPSGDYVAYGDLFYSVKSKTGYPLSVVADIAAGQFRQVVLIPWEGILAFISGESRGVHFPNMESDINSSEFEQRGFRHFLLRMTLLSDHPDVVVVGEIPGLGDIDIQAVALADLILPPVIKRSRSWIMLTLFVGLILLGEIANMAVSSTSKKDISHAEASLAAAQAEMAVILQSVEDGRTRLNTAVKPSEVAIGLEELPLQKISYLAQFYENTTPPTNIIRVTHGQFQY